MKTLINFTIGDKDVKLESLNRNKWRNNLISVDENTN